MNKIIDLPPNWRSIIQERTCSQEEQGGRGGGANACLLQ